MFCLKDRISLNLDY